MRKNLFVIGSALLVFAGCDALKRGKEKEKNETVTTSSSSTTETKEAPKKNTETTENAEKPETKPATSGCEWPEHGDHDITITKGCKVTAKDSLELKDGATLTIEEGVTISFETDRYIWVHYGKLIVKGTAAAPVTFTSANKSPAAGDWIGIGFEEKTMAGTSIDHAILEYTGSKNNGGVGAIELRNMRQGGRIAITNTTIRNGAQFGIVTDDNGTFAKFENNTFKDNAKGSVRAVAETLGSFGKGNTFSQPIHIRESKVDENATWPPLDVPVFVDAVITIASDSSVPTLTIADKTVLKFAKDEYMNIGDGAKAGALVAKNVTFTSGSPAPSPGDWAGLFLHAKSNGTDIENCTFEFFGSSNQGSHGAITLYNTNAKDLTSVTIKNNTFTKAKQEAMGSDDHLCAPYDKQNKADGIPFCNDKH
jgi:hypothetical protein